MLVWREPNRDETDLDKISLTYLSLFFLYLRYLDSNYKQKKSCAANRRTFASSFSFSHFLDKCVFCSGNCTDQTGSRCERISRTSLAMFNIERPLTKWVLASSLYLCLRYLCNMFKWRSCSLPALALSLTITRSEKSHLPIYQLSFSSTDAFASITLINYPYIINISVPLSGHGFTFFVYYDHVTKRPE